MTPKMSQIIARALVAEPNKLVEKLALAIQNNGNLCHFLVEDVAVPSLSEDEVKSLVEDYLERIYDNKKELVSIDYSSVEYKIDDMFKWQLHVKYRVVAYFEDERAEKRNSWDHKYEETDGFTYKGVYNDFGTINID